MTYITTYPPSGVRVFNATWTALHTLRECIHVLRKRSQDIPRSTCPRCAVVTSRTMDTQPLLHDRDCPQANLTLRGCIRDSHHPVGGYLPSYLLIPVSLPPVKTIIILIWASKRMLTVGFQKYDRQWCIILISFDTNCDVPLLTKDGQLLMFLLQLRKHMKLSM
jgi:hypothetical protein